MRAIGLTGGIASGKSTVARLLLERGASVIDADVLAHEVMAADAGLRAALADAFGKEILSDTGIDRAALGRKVFGKPESLVKLNRLVHPPVIERIAEIVAEWRASPEKKIGIVQVPLLVEAGMTDMFDGVVVVVSSPEIQVRRLIETGLTEEEAFARLGSQARDWERLRYADLTIINKGNLKLLEEQTEVLWQRLNSSQSLSP